MTYDNREDQFLRQRLQKEIPITFGFDTDSLGSYTRRHLQQVPDPANTGNASDHSGHLRSVSGRIRKIRESD